MTQHEIAARIKQLRRKKSAEEERDVTQEEVAGAAGLSLESFSRYENGKRRVPEHAIGAIARYYGVKPAFIRYGEPSGEPVYGGQVNEADALVMQAELNAKLAQEQPTSEQPAQATNGPPATRPHDGPKKRAAGDRRRRGSS